MWIRSCPIHHLLFTRRRKAFRLLTAMSPQSERTGMTHRRLLEHRSITSILPLHLQPRHKRIAGTIGRMTELELGLPILHPETRNLEVVIGFRRIDAQHEALPDLATVCRRPLKCRCTRHTRHRQLITYNYTGNGKLKLAIMAYPDRQSLGDGGWQRLRCPCPPKNQAISKIAR